MKLVLIKAKDYMMSGASYAVAIAVIISLYLFTHTFGEKLTTSIAEMLGKLRKKEDWSVAS